MNQRQFSTRVRIVSYTWVDPAVRVTCIRECRRKAQSGREERDEREVRTGHDRFKRLTNSGMCLAKSRMRLDGPAFYCLLPEYHTALRRGE